MYIYHIVAAIRVNSSRSLFLDRKLRRLLIYVRIGIMAMLDYYGKDGVLYQEIKDAFKLSDGSLGPNLTWLKDNKYIEERDEEIEGHNVAVYYATDEGKLAYIQVKKWLDTLLHASDNSDKEV